MIDHNISFLCRTVFILSESLDEQLKTLWFSPLQTDDIEADLDMVSVYVDMHFQGTLAKVRFQIVVSVVISQRIGSKNVIMCLLQTRITPSERNWFEPEAFTNGRHRFIFIFLSTSLQLNGSLMRR